MKAILIPALCSIIFFCGSCKKDSVSDNNILPQGTLLKKFVVLDLSLSAPNDTSLVFEYTYDNLNRCTVIKTTSYPSIDIAMTYNYFNGSDTLISSRIMPYNNGVDTAKEIFMYNAAGQIVSDSTVNIYGGIAHSGVYSYQISGNIITLIYGNSVGTPTLKGIYHIQYDNGNHLAEKDSLYNYYTGSGYVYQSVSDLANTYDSHPCPFYNLYPHRVTALDYENDLEDDMPLYWSIIQKNNTLTESRVTDPTTTGLQPYNNSYSYTYGSNSYPSTVNSTDNLTGGHYKGVYIY